MRILIDGTNPVDDRYYLYGVMNVDLTPESKTMLAGSYKGPVNLKYVHLYHDQLEADLKKIRYTHVELTPESEEWLRRTWPVQLAEIEKYNGDDTPHDLYAHLLCRIFCDLYDCEAVWHLAE